MSAGLEQCDRVLELVGPGAQAVVTVAQGRSALTRFARSVIHQNMAEERSTVSVRVVVEDGRSAQARTTAADRDGLARLVGSTLAAARLRPPDPDWPGLAPPAPLPEIEHHDDATRDASPEHRATVVEAFVAADPDLHAAGFCATEGVTRALASTAGQRVVTRSSSATVDGIHRTATSDGSWVQSSVRLADLDGAEAGQRAAATARAAADAIDLEPGTYEVVLGPRCVATVLEFLAYAGFNAKAHADGTSFVQLGEQQLDPAVDLWDDATDPRTLGPLFDAEGTPKRRVELVQRGTTVGLAHDRRTAAKAGTESTGHSVGQDSFGAYPSNLFLAHGDRSTEELVGAVERGLLVNDFWYTRILDPKTQVVTGLTRNGLFLVERGEVTRPVSNLRFTQSFVGALAPGRVLGIGAESRLIDGAHVPPVHLAAWRFTGGAGG